MVRRETAEHARVRVGELVRGIVTLADGDADELAFAERFLRALAGKPRRRK